MKAALFATLIVIAAPAGMALADTAAGCTISGQNAAASAECKVQRVEYLAEVRKCMDALVLEAKARTGGTFSSNSHSSRGQFLRCAAEVDARRGLKTP